MATRFTSRLKLGTGVCTVPPWDPIILANQVATIDYLSGGRFLFGVGSGWLVEELRNHGVEPLRRWDLMSEQIFAMKEIRTREEAEYHGQFVNFDPIWLWPKPVQVPHPPVLVGGEGLRSLRVAATHGDGWMPVVGDALQFETRLTQLRLLCEEAGRPDIEITACMWEIDEKLMARCAELGAARLVLYVPTEDKSALESFLDRYLDVAESVCS